MAVTRIEKKLGAGTLIIETGKLAKQAHGAVTVQYGETVVLTAAALIGCIPQDGMARGAVNESVPRGCARRA